MVERADTRGLHAGINIKIPIVRYYPRPAERKPDFSSGCQPAKTHGRRPDPLRSAGRLTERDRTTEKIECLDRGRGRTDTPSYNPSNLSNHEDTGSIRYTRGTYY